MEPAYHLPPIHSPAKGMQACSNSFRNKEAIGKTQLPPLKRVVTPAGIEKEKIKTPKPECQQQTVHKKKTKKKRNRCRSHEPTYGFGKNDSDESPALSQSVHCAIRFNAHPSSLSSSPKVNGQHHFAFLQSKEFDCETTDDVSGRYEGDTRIHEEPYDTREGKGQNKEKNYKSRNLDQLRCDPLQRLNDSPQEFHYPRNTERAINSTCVRDDGPSFLQVNSNGQFNSRREGREDFPEEIRGTEKWFHQKRRGTRIVQSKDHHHHPILPLEFPPHPPPQFPNPTSRSQHVAMSHPNLPATDSRLYPSNLSRNSYAQLRQVCMHGGSASSFASEFQPHPPLQPRTVTNYQLRQCHVMNGCRPAGVALETQAYQTSPIPRNTTMHKPNRNREVPSSGINDRVLSPSETQPYFPTRVCLPPNCQWAIIDNAGSVIPLPPGTIPVSVNNNTNEAEDGRSLNPSEDNSEDEELLHPNALIASNIVIESPSLGDLPKREQRCLSAGKVDEMLPDGIFEKVPSSSKNCWNLERSKSTLESASQSNCKPLRQSLTEPYLAAYLKESSGDGFGGDVTEQSGVSSCPNADKKQRNFKLPTGWYSNSKNWFKSPFKKEKKQHRKTSTVPTSKNHLPSLLSIEEFSSLSISDQERQMTSAGNVKKSTNEPKTKKSVYTLEEFLKVCEEDGDDSSDGVF